MDRPGPGNVTGGPGSATPTRINYNFATLRFLVMQAYSVLDLQVSGPDWIDSERYTITANVPPGATPQQVHAMLRTLLEERFHLKIHHESKVLPVYELTVDKAGYKLRVSPDVSPDAPVNPTTGLSYVDGVPVFPPGRVGLSPGARYISASHQPVSELAKFLTARMRTTASDQKPVIDKTGLTGYYDFVMRFTPPVELLQPDPQGGAADPTLPPDIYTALQKDLGLKLEDKKAPLDVIVVDEARQKPEEN